MDSTSTAPALTPSPAGYSLQDWVKIINNGAQVPKDHPRYAEVRALMDQALQQVTAMHHQQNMADKMDAVDHPYSPGYFGSALAGGAEGMSMGLGSLAGDDFQAYLSQARQDNPKTTWASNAVGSAIPTAVMGGMPLFADAAPVAVGIATGLQTGLETGSPTKGAIGAGISMIGGAAIGKAAKIVGLDKVAGRALSAIASKLGIGAEEGAAGAAARPQVKGTMGPLVKPAPDPLETATYTRNAAAKAAANAISTDQLRQNLLKFGVPPKEIESAVQTALRTHMAEAPTAAELHGILAGGGKGAPATPASALVSELQQLQAKLGRALTADEKERVLAAKLPEVSPHDPQAAARSAYHLSEAAGDKDPRVAARRAAGTYSNWDPRQALGVAPIAAVSTSSR